MAESAGDDGAEGLRPALTTVVWDVGEELAAGQGDRLAPKTKRVALEVRMPGGVGPSIAEMAIDDTGRKLLLSRSDQPLEESTGASGSSGPD